jgi:hypothetical protein
MRRNGRDRQRRADSIRLAAASFKPFAVDLPIAREEDEAMWAMRDYFWMVHEGLLAHAPGAWASFRDGYAAITRDTFGVRDASPCSESPRRMTRAYAYELICFHRRAQAELS